MNASLLLERVERDRRASILAGTHTPRQDLACASLRAVADLNEATLLELLVETCEQLDSLGVDPVVDGVNAWRALRPRRAVGG